MSYRSSHWRIILLASALLFSLLAALTHGLIAA